MMYIWEVLLQANAQKFPRENLRFRQVSSPTPYMEVAYDEINRGFVDSKTIDINAYYRFNHIFDYLLDDELAKYPELQETLYDILMHYLAEIDLRRGLCKNEYYQKFLQQDLQNSKFGKQYADIICGFPHNQIRFILESMVKLYEIGPSVTMLRTVLRQLYPNSIIYLDSVERRELLVYIGKKETAELRKQVDFLIDMFVPFDYIVHLFWNMHFGIVGVNETLELDDFIVY